MTIATRVSLLLIFPASLFAQSAGLSGFIKDPQSEPVPQVSVEVRNEATGAISRTATNSQGIYTLPALNPGKYDLTAQATGFKTLTRDGITLEVEQRARLDLTLELGSVEEKVTVSGDALMINTADASVSTVVDRQFVENIPLNGRSFQNLIALTPGAITTSTSPTSEQGQFSIAGQRAGSNYFNIDGVGANFAVTNGVWQGQTANGSLPAFSAVGSTASLVSIDALQEFRLVSSSYAPEYGRESGGQVVMVTRSGTNRFHGTAFDYVRNDVFDANDWFAGSTGQPKPRERQNDFGGVLGGPIVKDKTFFFFSYEGLRLAQPKVTVSDVPSLAARSSAPPDIKVILDAFARPNGPATGVDLAQFSASYSDPATLNATSLRIDHAVGSKVTIFGRFNYSPSNLANRADPNTLSTIHQNVLTATAGSTAILSPSTSNDLRLNYSRASGGLSYRLDTFGGGVVPPAGALAPSWLSLNQGPFYWAAFDGRLTELIAGPISKNLNRQFNLVDTVAVIKGTHSLKFGVDFRRLTPIAGPAPIGGNAYWNFMSSAVKGLPPDDMGFTQDPNPPRLRFLNFSAFAQDTWKASRRLTLTYGVRWDYNPPPSEENGNTYAFNETTDLARAVLLPKGSRLWQGEWKNFAPRVGGSYLLRQGTERSTVLRFGFGQFYDLGTSTAGFVDDGAQGYFPYALSDNICGLKPTCTTPYPFTGPRPPFVFTQPYFIMAAFDRHLKLPHSLQWNVALEQALSANETFKIAYVGSAGRNLLKQDLISNPNPIVTNLVLTTNAGYSNYESLQLQFQRRLSHGLQAVVSYSWSHSLDSNSSDVTSEYNGGTATGGLPPNLENPGLEYGNSDFDTRQTFSAALTYNVPMIRSGNSFARALLRDWSIDSINTARTGTYFNVLYTPTSPGAYFFRYGGFALRPDTVAGQPVWISDPNAPGGKKLNQAAFSIPAVLGQGTQGRNTISGFPLLQMDLAVRREFVLKEDLRLQLRVEGFNVINHPNFGNPLNSIGKCAQGVPCAANFGFGISQSMLNQALGGNHNFFSTYGNAFGSIYQVGGPRSFQISMKLQF